MNYNNKCQWDVDAVSAFHCKISYTILNVYHGLPPFVCLCLYVLVIVKHNTGSDWGCVPLLSLYV